MPTTTTPTMQILKRNGNLEDVDAAKILAAISRHTTGLEPYVDVSKVAERTISGLYSGCSTQELDWLSIRTSASLISEEPEYGKLGARLLANLIHKEVEGGEIFSFSQSISSGYTNELISDKTMAFVSANKQKLNRAIDNSRDDQFEFMGLYTLYSRYFLKHPESRTVLETPQYLFMRVACGLAETAAEAIELYRLLSSFQVMTATPTLFNSGTSHPQLSSCYLRPNPEDSIESIFNNYGEIAQLSKYAGGIGSPWSSIRSRGSLIKSTNGVSNGVVPWLRILDATISSCNQGGKRPGACAAYLAVWHSCIEEFLEIRDNTGDSGSRTYNLNTALWIPDIFMRRVKSAGLWSVFDPKKAPLLLETFGTEFESAYEEYERKSLYDSQIPAVDLYAKMVKSAAQTGNFWFCFSDTGNRKSNQTGLPNNIIHSSNLCVEIEEVSSQEETAVCNLQSVNLARHFKWDEKEQKNVFDWQLLAKNVRTAIKYLDRVIDVNFYPIESAERSNKRWRSVGFGMMGLQDAFFLQEFPFDSDEAREFSTRVQREIYYNALVASNELAKELGSHPSYAETRIARDGKFQFELWGMEIDRIDPNNPSEAERWYTLRESISKFGLRNSLLLATAPTATIASITGCYESIEPQAGNAFKREALGGDFMCLNQYLVSDLRSISLWNQEIRDQIKLGNGSIQEIKEIPESLRRLYRTAWELSMRSIIDLAADRGPYICQSQSLNLYSANPTIDSISSMYYYLWSGGNRTEEDIKSRGDGMLKTSYYLRSKGATQIAKTAIVVESDEEQPLICVLAPVGGEPCEVCQ